MHKLIVYTDGASRGNPGPGGIGAVLERENGQAVAQISEYIGEATNNVAEYTALIRALEEASQLGARELDVFTDSELVVKQIKGEYRVKNEGLKPLYRRVKELIEGFSQFTIMHIGREQNKMADSLANKGIDNR